jgi:hypothetical protein
MIHRPALRGCDSVKLAATYGLLSTACGEVASSCLDNRLKKTARALGWDVSWPTLG